MLSDPRSPRTPSSRAIAPSTKAQPEPEPIPVATTRATVVDVGDPLSDADQAAAWLKRAGEAELAAGLAVLNRALHAHRSPPPIRPPHGVGRSDALVARLGYGAGEQVADGSGPTRAS